ncbi:MAG: acyl-CoA dehydrogenase, partial [Gammaproteobacteria bacterium]
PGWHQDPGLRRRLRRGPGGDRPQCGAPGERAGLQAFVVDADAPGLSRMAYAMHDGQRAADLRLDGVTVDASRRLVPAEGTEVGDALERVVDHGIAALAAEAVGAMAVLVDTTLDYLKTRQQFGRPIGTNQALQHRMVDMTIALDEARSMALYAALMLREADAPARRRALSAAKMEIDRTARLVGQEAVQMHGAMGVTEELAVGHYFKRLSMIRLGFGDADWHAERYMAQ